MRGLALSTLALAFLLISELPKDLVEQTTEPVPVSLQQAESEDSGSR